VSDTAEFGGWPRPPRWVWVIAGIAAAALLAGEIAAHAGPRHPSAAPRPRAPASLPSGQVAATGSGARWPTAAGDCGSPAYLPRIQLDGHERGLGVTALVGGTALRQVGPQGTVSPPLPGLRDQGLVVTKLVAGPGAAYAFVDPRCNGYLWVYRIAAGVARPLAVSADDLIGGPRHAWAVTYAPRAALTPLNGGRKITLAAGTNPVADTPAGLVVTHAGPRAGRPGTVELVDPGTGTVLRRLAAGSPLGAGGGVALVSRPGCGTSLAHRTCTLETIGLRTGRVAARFTLPAGRVPVSGAVFSADGTAAAFHLARAGQGPAFPGGRASPPADVAVLHLRTGSLDIVPGLELAPGTAAGLAFGATGGWLLLTVNEGDHGELLAWRRGMPGPALVTSLPGPLMAAPPLLAAPPLVAEPGPRAGQSGQK
jgi:hypothetical protein